MQFLSVSSIDYCIWNRPLSSPCCIIVGFRSLEETKRGREEVRADQVMYARRTIGRIPRTSTDVNRLLSYSPLGLTTIVNAPVVAPPRRRPSSLVRRRAFGGA